MIHKEGKMIIVKAALLFTAVYFAIHFSLQIAWLNYLIGAGLSILFLLIIWFFRNPVRVVKEGENTICAPADGKVVVIEKVYDKEYFKAERIQVSIFMSPLNVHVNRYPINGEIKYVKYYPGKYLVAWHPKSSELNEHSVIVVSKQPGKEVLLKQIAGAVARRIVTYSKVGDKAEQGRDLGFIKFGSRVDLLLPLDANVTVQLNEKVFGNLTQIAKFN